MNRSTYYSLCPALAATARPDSDALGNRGIFGWCDALLAGAGAPRAFAVNLFPDSDINKLLAGSTANHEKDAYMLRALLWEDKDNPS